ncbi:MAG: HU family DNA-binding protein [Bacteroidales bacterium]
MGKLPYKLVPISGTEKIHHGNTLYRPSIVTIGEITLDRLAKEISDKSTLTEADIYATICAIANEVNNYLKEGYRVNLGPLGSLKLKITNDKPILDPDKPTNNLIRLSGIDYVPDEKISLLQHQVTFARRRYNEHLSTYDETTRLDNILQKLKCHYTISARLVRAMNHVSHEVAVADLEKLIDQGKIRKILHGNYWLYEEV